MKACLAIASSKQTASRATGAIRPAASNQVTSAGNSVAHPYLVRDTPSEDLPAWVTSAQLGGDLLSAAIA
jgi:hypothetical protein